MFLLNLFALAYKYYSFWAQGMMEKDEGGRSREINKKLLTQISKRLGDIDKLFERLANFSP